MATPAIEFKGLASKEAQQASKWMLIPEIELASKWMLTPEIELPKQSKEAIQDALLEMFESTEQPDEKPELIERPSNEERLRKFLKRMDSAY